MKLALIGLTLAALGGLTASLLRTSTATPNLDPRVTADGLFLTRNTHPPLPQTEHAAFAAGCFWGVEEEFRKQPGVVATAVGFMGGHVVAPSYEEVCRTPTGHAETVELAYDPKVVSYRQLLDLFWNLHDPTTPGRQGPDVGDQYRSVIFAFTPAQRAEAQASRDRLQASGELSSPIVTEIVAATPFYPAEGYHQQYVEKGGRAACHIRRHAPVADSTK